MFVVIILQRCENFYQAFSGKDAMILLFCFGKHIHCKSLDYHNDFTTLCKLSELNNLPPLKALRQELILIFFYPV